MRSRKAAAVSTEAKQGSRFRVQGLRGPKDFFGTSGINSLGHLEPETWRGDPRDTGDQGLRRA